MLGLTAEELSLVNSNSDAKISADNCRGERTLIWLSEN